MQKLSIYIPSDHPQAEQFVRQILRDVSLIAGGASSYPVTGSWLNAYHVLVQEPITVIYTLAVEAVAPQVQLYLQKIAREIKNAMAQEAVLITVEDVKTATVVS